MANIYITPGLATGNNDGTDPANAFQSWAAFLAVGGSSGDIAMVNADEIVSSSLNWVGTRLNGVIIRGMSSDWSTKEYRKIDANSAAISGLAGSGLSGVTVEYIEFTRFNKSIITNAGAGSTLIRLLNCKFTNSLCFTSFTSGTGLGQIVADNCLISNMANAANFGTGPARTIFTNCKFINHTNYITGTGINIQFHKCSFLSSGGGLSGTSTVQLHDCVFDSITNDCINATSLQSANNVLFSRAGRVFNISGGRHVVSNLTKYAITSADSLGTGELYWNNDGNGNNYRELTELPFIDPDNGNYNLVPSANVKIPIKHGTETDTKLFMSAGLPSDNTIYPSISYTTPSYGSSDGSNITLSGIGLSGCTSLLFGSTPGSIVSSDYGFVSGVVPALSPGRYDITASGAAGVAVLASGWTSVGMDRKITSITKSVGDVNGYMVVRLYSEEGLFLNAQSVDFEGIPARSFTVIDANNIDAVLPKLDPSFYTVSVN